MTVTEVASGVWRCGGRWVNWYIVDRGNETLTVIDGGRAARPRPMPASTPMLDGDTLDVPGRPVVAHAPGHTDGSCVLDFREHNVVFVGDLLCMSSPLTGRWVDPQIQTRGSNRDSAQNIASIDRLDGVTANLVLPDHGAPWRDGVMAAADSARRFGCR